jgi:hypothetical protein
VLIRKNCFRYLNGVAGTDERYAIQIKGAEAVIISGNIVETIPTAGDAIQVTDCPEDSVRIFDNRAPAMVEFPADRYVPELARLAEDALVSACFER